MKGSRANGQKILCSLVLQALAHPVGDQTGANVHCTETVVFTPRKQLVHSPYAIPDWGGCIYLLFPLFVRIVGVSQCRIWGSELQKGVADPSENDEASK